MKTTLLIMTLIISAQASATVQMSEGQIAIEPVFESEAAALVITGSAADQLYNLLQVAPSGSVKTGQNILCRQVAKPGGNTLSTECSMEINPAGSVTAVAF